MATSYKAQAIMKEMGDKLASRGLSSLGFTYGFSATDSNPTLAIGSGSAGSANFIIKVAPVDWPTAKDVLGNAANMFTPHTIFLCTEADYAGATDNVADPTTRAQLLPVIGQLIAMGCEVKWYETATGTAPTVTRLENGTATLKATFQPDHYHSLISSQ